MHEELGAQEFGIILRGEIWKRSEDGNGILNRSALFICFGIGAQKEVWSREIILSSTKRKKRRTELRTELSAKRDGDGEIFKAKKQPSFVYCPKRPRFPVVFLF